MPSDGCRANWAERARLFTNPKQDHLAIPPIREGGGRYVAGRHIQAKLASKIGVNFTFDAASGCGFAPNSHLKNKLGAASPPMPRAAACSRAQIASCVRLEHRTLRRMAFMWTLMVASAIPHSLAMILLD
jgi:hypothetical protein